MPIRLAPLCCVLVLLLGFSSVARAGNDDDDEEDAPRYRTSLFISPLSLLFARTVQIGGEFRYSPKVSFAALGAAGSPGYTFLELGGQARRYLIGDFQHGLNVGGEINVSYASWRSSTVFVPASGLGVGGFVGYKLIARFGVTVDVNAGVLAYGIGRSRPSDAALEIVPGLKSQVNNSAVLVGPLVRLNFGWSF